MQVTSMRCLNQTLLLEAGETVEAPRWAALQERLFQNVSSLGFAGNDTNLYRYVGNYVTGMIDPEGLAEKLPGASRGAWVEGARGNGVFEYSNTLLNQQKGMVGKQVRFSNNHIAIGGFPAEYYYGGNVSSASVEITKVDGTKLDFTQADAYMRELLGDPDWKRPSDFTWNHAGEPGSKVLELADRVFHKKVHHKGAAAVKRAEAKAARLSTKATPAVPAAPTTTRGARVSAKGIAILDAYLTVRDAAQAAGLLNPDFDVHEKFDYKYVADDDSIFVVEVPQKWILSFFQSPQRRFVAGDREGQTEIITPKEAAQYKDDAEKLWGKYTPETYFRDPTFVPGTERKSVPYTLIDEHGFEYDAGYVDENGLHRYETILPRRNMYY